MAKVIIRKRNYYLVIVLIICFVFSSPKKSKSEQLINTNYTFLSLFLTPIISYDIESLDTNLIIDKNPASKKKKNGKTQEIWIQDNDGDGVPDHEDLCPDIPGSIKAQGCPDADDDGVPDFEDECPDIPGLPEFKGCPDTDGDGIPDHKDDCPYEKGPASNNGCPIGFIKKISDDDVTDAKIKIVRHQKHNNYNQETSIVIEANKDYDYYIELARQLEEAAKVNNTSSFYTETEYNKTSSDNINDGYNNVTLLDTDNDGVPDIEDKCPKIPGPKSNYGCPVEQHHKLWKVSKRDIILSNEDIKVLDNVFNNLSFFSGRSILNDESYSFLNQLADLLNKKFSWRIILHCYTNEGGENSIRNQNLSFNRGDHIRNYLTKKGINYNRIQIIGHGQINAPQYISANRVEVEITR